MPLLYFFFKVTLPCFEYFWIHLTGNQLLKYFDSTIYIDVELITTNLCNNRIFIIVTLGITSVMHKSRFAIIIYIRPTMATGTVTIIY